MKKSLLLLLGAFIFIGIVLVGCGNDVKPSPSPDPTPSPDPSTNETVTVTFDCGPVDVYFMPMEPQTFTKGEPQAFTKGEPQAFTKGEPQALNKNTFINDGWVFESWGYYTTSGKFATYHKLYDDEETITLNEDITLYAHWTKDTSGSFIVDINEAFNMGGQIGVSGRVRKGTIKKNDFCQIVGFDKTYNTTIAQLTFFNKEVDTLEVNDTGGIRFPVGAGFSPSDISPGMVVCTPNCLTNHKKFTATIKLLTPVEGGGNTTIYNGEKINLVIFNASFEVTLSLSGNKIEPGDIQEVSFELPNKLAIYENLEFQINSGTKKAGKGVITSLID